MRHIPQIKKALGISGIYSLSSSFYKKGTAAERGLQIDLLIDRNDHVINLIEIKFYNKIFTISKAYAETLRQKKGRFEEITKTKKQITWVFITAHGLKKNEYALELVDKHLMIGDLFSVPN